MKNIKTRQKNDYWSAKCNSICPVHFDECWGIEILPASNFETQFSFFWASVPFMFSIRQVNITSQLQKQKEDKLMLSHKFSSTGQYI